MTVHVDEGGLGIIKHFCNDLIDCLCFIFILFSFVIEISVDSQLTQIVILCILFSG